MSDMAPTIVTHACVHALLVTALVVALLREYGSATSLDHVTIAYNYIVSLQWPLFDRKP
jgi:hypothetical protein